jgi:hypothetical protein
LSCGRSPRHGGGPGGGGSRPRRRSFQASIIQSRSAQVYLCTACCARSRPASLTRIRTRTRTRTDCAHIPGKAGARRRGVWAAESESRTDWTGLGLGWPESSTHGWPGTTSSCRAASLDWSECGGERDRAVGGWSRQQTTATELFCNGSFTLLLLQLCSKD